MTNNYEKLARMANQIAGFFRTYPHDQAIAGVQEHIRSFWSPVMRRDLQACIDDESVKLDDLVIAAAKELATGRSPAKKEKAGPEEVGAIDASDAG